MIRVVGTLLFAFALLLAGFGIYALVRKDVQGGADEVGVILLSVATIAAILGGIVVWGSRRWS